MTAVPLPRQHIRAGLQGRRIRIAALRAPLVTKLVGANLLVVAIMLVAWRVIGGTMTRSLAITSAAVVVLQLSLVLLALRPIRDLERAVARLWRGDFRARVERSSLADNDVLLVGSMINILLDGLDSDLTRMQALASEVIAVGDRERAAIARELHESTAQQLAALQFQLAAAARDATDIELADRLHQARDAAEEILVHVRALSQSVHPGVLDDLGLDAALRKLARDFSNGNGIDIDVSTDDSADRLPPTVEAALYRVAHEAVRNAAHHASPRRLKVSVSRRGPSVTLEVTDDGIGFDLVHAQRPGKGMGLLCMRERVALVNGSLEIRTAKGNGTTITATVPVETARRAEQLESA
jgi:signal transduction histidine kinase